MSDAYPDRLDEDGTCSECGYEPDRCRCEYRNPQPNLIERLDNLIWALGEAHNGVGEDDKGKAWTNIETAEGIAGEILTMIDGR
jgi:hypothetical protein